MVDKSEVYYIIDSTKDRQKGYCINKFVHANKFINADSSVVNESAIEFSTTHLM